ncbi:hypothetical protein BKA56DRAFT_601920 [Ilyonectria sp. MPI-CAGE-AT-0026]|nr:hypothetical protein BKA56DRAFT_601920 [Ilyonectria sp. MPI-CAGE-AT-0026]
MYMNQYWACRDSRVVCNRVRPCCTRCARLNRLYYYRLRLFLTYSVYDIVGTVKCFSQMSFVNAILDPSMALLWLLTNLGYEDRELIDYFIYTASSTLAIFESDKNEFLSLLLRLALSDSLPSSVAARALRILIISSKYCVESPTMLGMLNILSLWFCEVSRLLDWVEYHIVMSRFSYRYWYLNGESTRGETCYLRKVKIASHCSYELLRHLYNIFDMIRKPTDSLYHSDEYENSLRCLENKITSVVPLAPKGIPDTMSDLSTAWVATMDLLKLAALIYLKRVSQNFSGTSPQIDAMVEKAYVLLDDLGTFNLAFLLLIIGCEARIDEQRIRILEYIERVIRTSTLRSLHGLQNIL